VRITGKLEVSDEILGSGGFADVRSGTYEGRVVAVKTMRVVLQGDFPMARKVSIGVHRQGCGLTILPQRFCKGVVLWSTLSHPNVLKLVGVQEDKKRLRLVTVSERMVRGNIMQYINTNHANRLELVGNFTIPTAPFAEIQQ